MRCRASLVKAANKIMAVAFLVKQKMAVTRLIQHNESLITDTVLMVNDHMQADIISGELVAGYGPSPIIS